MVKAPNKHAAKKVVMYVVLGIAVVSVGILAYRYYNRPVQTWSAGSFEARSPDKVELKSQGQSYWAGAKAGDGFYITDEAMSSSDSKTYCVSGGVTSDSASFTLGSATIEASNGFFTRCAKLSVNDKHQLTFTVDSGSVQVYRVDRKR